MIDPESVDRNAEVDAAGLGEMISKCEKYWPGPGKTKTQVNVQIKCESVTNKDEIEVEKLEIRKLKTTFKVRTKLKILLKLWLIVHFPHLG